MARIYTRTGDEGDTYCAALGTRVPKDHVLIEFMGTLDEANSLLGIAAANCEGEVKGSLEDLQRLLFRVGFSLGGFADISEADIESLEEIVDAYMAGVELKGFVIPGGDMCSSYIHLARTVVRRAERRLVSAHRSGVSVKAGEDKLKLAIKVLNRMSDALYAMAVGVQARKGGLKYL